MKQGSRRVKISVRREKTSPYCENEPTIDDSVVGGMEVDEDLDDFDLYNTQVAEPEGKRWKMDNVAKEMRTHCAEDMKDMMSRMIQTGISVWLKDLIEQLSGMVKGISASLEGRMSELEAKMQNQLTVFEKMWMQQIVKLDDVEVTVTQAEHRSRMKVQKEVEEMFLEGPHGKGVQDPHEQCVVCLKSRSHGSAASTVAASTGCGGARATSQLVWR